MTHGVARAAHDNGYNLYVTGPTEMPVSTMRTLEAHVCVVTGRTFGVGRGIATALAQHGAHGFGRSGAHREHLILGGAEAHRECRLWRFESGDRQDDC